MQIDAQLIDLSVKALIGAGGLLVGFVGGWSALYWRTREQRADYEDLKRKRRLTNAKAAEQAELLGKHADVFVKLKTAGATPEDLRAFIDQATAMKRRQRTRAKTEVPSLPSDAVLKDALWALIVRSDGKFDKYERPGLNIIHDDGQKYVTRPNANTPNDEDDMDIIDIPRDWEEIRKAEGELFYKVWYNRHKVLRENVEAGEETVDPKVWEGALKSAERTERDYDLSDWPWDDFEWGMINGKLSALRWVTGSAWDFLDT